MAKVMEFLKGKGWSEKNTVTADDVSETIPDIKEEEAEKVSKKYIKKRYMYIAVNCDGEVILDKNGEPFLQTVEEGSSPRWDEKIDNYTESVRTDPRLRVEIEQIPQNLTGNARKRVKEEKRDMAKKELLEIAADKIEAAREKSGKSKAETIPSQKLESEVLQQEVHTPEQEILTPEPEAHTPEEKTAHKEPSGKDKEKFPEVGNADVIQAVKEAGEQINRGIGDAFDDIGETIDKNNEFLLSKVRAQIDTQGRRTDERTRKYTEDAAQAVIQKTQKLSENIISCVNDSTRSIGETRDELASKVKGIGKSLGEIGESVDGIVWDMHKLDQLDEITELLKHKGLTMSMEIPPVNADEEDIVNLVRYSQKITQQLGYAARDLLRKQEAFRSQEKSNENEQKMMEQNHKKAYEEGVNEGRKQVIKALLSKFEDVDTLRKSQVDHVHVLWTLLEEMGVCIDGDGRYEKAETIEITDDQDIQKMMATYSGIDGTGRYEVVRTGLSFQGEVISAAEFRKI